MERKLSVDHIVEKIAPDADPGIPNSLPINALLKSAFDAVVSIDTRQRITTFNHGAEQLFGYQASEIIGQEIDLLIPSRFAERHHEHVNEFLQSDELSRPMDGDLRTVFGRHKDNHEIALEAIICKTLPVRSQDPSLFVFIRNISSRKRAESILREQEAYFREQQSYLAHILAAIPVGVYEANREGRFTFVNEKFCQLTGLDISQALGDGWMKSIYHEDRQRVLQEWSDAREHHQPLHLEYRLVNTKGKVTWVLGRALAVHNDKGEISGYIGSLTDISERIAAEHALRESEIRFRTLFNTSPTPIGLTRMSDGCFLDVNQALSELFGWSREEFVGKTSHDLGMWVNEAERKAITDKLRKGEPIHNMQLQVRLRSGEVRDTLTSVDTMQLDGTPCLLVANTDVTDQIKAASLLKQHSRLLDTLSAVNELLLQESDPNNLFQKTCQVIIEQAGFRMAWIGIADLAEGSVTPVADAGMEQGYLSNIKVRCDNSKWGQGPTGIAIRENRTVVVVDTNSDPSYAAWREQARKHNFRSSVALPLRHNDQVFGALNIYSEYGNDFGPEELALLERMSADLGLVHERLEMQKALQNSENRLASFFSDAPAGLVLYDKDLRFLQINSTLAEFGNTTSEIIIGKRPREILPTDLAEFIEENVKTVFDRGEPIINKEFSGILPVARGELRHWMHSHFPVRDTEGRVYAVGGFVIEISMQKQAEAALKKLNQELESRVAERTGALAAANAELETFAYSVSHDLRTPLRSINGYSQIILEDYKDKLDLDAHHYLTRIIRAVNHMGALIDALLALSRLSTKELVIHEISGEDVTNMVSEVAREIELEYDSQKIDWHIDSLSGCRVDKILLRQVWFNLLHNAVKYSSHRERPSIQIGMLEQEGHMVYYVRDNGIGFENDYIDKLFGVFQRLHRPDEFEGTGIGLATVKRIIDMLGGEVWANGELNKGATFYFKLNNIINDS